MGNDFLSSPGLFSAGYCDSFALVMHERCGWPLGVIIRHTQDEFDGDEWLIPFAAHAVLIDPEDPAHIFDSKGYRTLKDAIDECLWASDTFFVDAPHLVRFDSPSEDFRSLFSSIDEIEMLRGDIVEFIEHHGFDRILESKSKFDANSNKQAPQP